MATYSGQEYFQRWRLAIFRSFKVVAWIYITFGTMNFGDITSHIMKSDRKARELGGRYDGWGTSVEKE